MTEIPPDLSPDPGAHSLEFDGFPMIPGILGHALDADSVRLYLDVTFETYYDIPRAAIIGRTRVDAKESPFGVDSTVVRVQPGTRIIVQHSGSRIVEEEFFSGDFIDLKAFDDVVPSRAAMAADHRLTAGPVSTSSDCYYRTSPNGGGCTRYSICQT